jgi:hypothetical protein
MVTTLHPHTRTHSSPPTSTQKQFLSENVWRGLLMCCGGGAWVWWLPWGFYHCEVGGGCVCVWWWDCYFFKNKYCAFGRKLLLLFCCVVMHINFGHFFPHLFFIFPIENFLLVSYKIWLVKNHVIIWIFNINLLLYYVTDTLLHYNAFSYEKFILLGEQLHVPCHNVFFIEAK